MIYVLLQEFQNFPETCSTALRTRPRGLTAHFLYGPWSSLKIISRRKGVKTV